MSFQCDLHIFPASFPRFTPRNYSSSQNKKNLLENIMQIPIEQIKTASYFAIPPNSAFHGLLEEFFFSISKIQNI